MKTRILFPLFLGFLASSSYGQHLLVLNRDNSIETETVLSDDSPNFVIHSIAAHPNGQLYILTSTQENAPFGSTALTLWRLLADGTPDASFGSGNGKLLLPGSEARQIFVQKDGNLLLCGSAICRYAPDGTRSADFPEFKPDQAVSIVAEQSDGHIILSNGQCLTSAGGSDAAITGRIQQWMATKSNLTLSAIDDRDRIYFRTETHTELYGDEAGPTQRLQSDGTEDLEYRGPAVDAIVQSPDRGLIGLDWKKYDPALPPWQSQLIGYDLAGNRILFNSRSDLGFLGFHVLPLSGDRYLFWGDAGSSGGGVQSSYKIPTVDIHGKIWAVVTSSREWGVPAYYELVRLSVPPVCSIRNLSDREIQIKLIGAAGSKFQLEASSEAPAPSSHWLRLEGATLEPNGDVVLTRTNVQPHEFYRAIRID